MANTVQAVEQRLNSDPSYQQEFAKAWGAGPIKFEMVAKSIASFERTLLSGDSPFDLGLSPSRDRNGRASRLSEAATYYDIIRRFPEGSMPQVLDLVDATFGTTGPLGTHNVDLVMTALAELFNQVFKRGVEIPSASKFLWWNRVF
jgi:hypothetical protein